MNRQLLGLIGAGAVAGLALGACELEQPLPDCPIAHAGLYSPGTLVHYTLVEGDDILSCAQRTYDLVGLAAYFDRQTAGALPRLAIRTEQMGLFDPVHGGEDPEEADALAALGLFDLHPSPDGFCTARNFSPAQVERPGQLLRYQWSNFRSVSTARVPGTQFTVDLTFTDENCTATYQGVGIHPAVECADDEGEPDNSLCQVRRDEQNNAILACNRAHECLNPDFKVRCDPVTLFCIPDGPVPALID
jgi:hypothetical protein